MNPHDIMFYSRTEPPADCAEVCDTLPANHHDDLSEAEQREMGPLPADVVAQPR